MGSIFKRRNCYWTKFRDPRTGEEIRESLETREEGVARCKLQKIELLCKLRRPEVTVTSLPAKLEKLLWDVAPQHYTAREEPPRLLLPPPAPSPILPAVTVPITMEKALTEYLAFISAENAH